jgi:hypothetical protein
VLTWETTPFTAHVWKFNITGMKLFFALLACGLSLSASAQEFRPLDLQEVLSVVRTNLTDISEKDLSHAAALGLIKELGTKVQLVTNNASAPQTPDEAISRRATYNENVAYVQIRAVDDRLPAEFQKWLASLTNSVAGLVLDLRYARGDDYEAAARVTDQFVKGGQTLLKLGPNEITSTEKSKPNDLPVVVLANRETRGAGEALAALIRETGTGLVIGSPTAGEARLFETLTLSTGQQLKIGTVPILIGGKPVPAKGLVPDITVAVNPAAEKIFHQDPFRMINPNTGQLASGSTNELASATNRARRFNEAELVRRHRAGTLNDELAPGAEGPAGADQPVVNDPVLARALDFLKGISALQQHRPL